MDLVTSGLQDKTEADKRDLDRLLNTEEGARRGHEDRDRLQKQALKTLAQLRGTARPQAEDLAEDLAALNTTLGEMQKQRALEGAHGVSTQASTRAGGR